MASNGNGGIGGMVMAAIPAAIFGFVADAITEAAHIPYLDDPAQFPIGGGPTMSNLEFWGYTAATVLGFMGVLSSVSKKPVMGFDKKALAQGAGLGIGIAGYEKWGSEALGIRPAQ